MIRFGMMATPAREGLNLTETIAQGTDLAKQAERWGFDTIGMNQHYAHAPNLMYPPLPWLTWLAAHTNRARLATVVLLATLQHPVELAEHIAMLDRLSNGRFIFGVGAAWVKEEFAALGVPFEHRGKRLEESLEIMTRLWTGEEVTFHGTCYNIDKVRLTLLPVQRPRPPIWIGANSNPVAVKRAARLADTWLLSGHPSFSEHAEMLKHYQEEMARLGKPFPPPDFPIMRGVHVAESMEEALKEARPALEEYNKQYGGWGLFADVLRRGYRYANDQALVEDRLIIGTPDDCIRQIKEINKRLGVNLFFVGPRGRTYEEKQRTLDLLVRHVLPAFQQPEEKTVPTPAGGNTHTRA